MSSVSIPQMKTAIVNALASMDVGTDADPKSVTRDAMVTALATGVCTEVNSWIALNYDTHVHTTTAAPSNGVTTGPEQPAP